MSGLNLVPNPTILAIQSGIFFTAIYTVKKLYLDPYLKLKEKRLNATVGNQQSAAQLLADNHKKLEQITASVKKGVHTAMETSEAIRKTSSAEKDKILQEADKAAKQSLDEIRTEISSELKTEKTKLPDVVKQLTEQVYAQTVN
jgi:F0F1-type ATP synthase membrane subunit b/b'